MAINVIVSGDGGSSSVNVSGGIGPAAYISGTNTAVIGVQPVQAGANITVSTTSGSYTIIGRDVPVLSVQGRTGNVVLTLNDLTAASFSHTHSTSQIVGLANAPVLSVQGRTGAVVLSVVDITAAGATHTHTASDVFGLPVVSVQGRTGNVFLSASDVTAASSSHDHKYVLSLNSLTGSPSIVSGGNITVTTTSDSILIAAPPGLVASVNSQTGPVSIVGGGIVNVSSSNGTVTISASGSTQAVSSAIWPVLILGG